ncbi:MAG TPA: hypothetical protein HPP57_08485 [Deltaproteobacteria bacterium]|jgi:hypothetical protein|nr:hypothetical protein [Deltaproteobacteria bacterium]
MELILKLFGTQVSLNSMFQIGVDVIILGLLGMILTVKKLRISKKDEVVMKSFENIVEETALISQRFEINLEKRRDLLQQITAKLDQRIQAAESLCTRLDQLSRINTDKLAVRHSPSAGPRPQGADQQKVILLARKGLDASEISKSLKRPVGEVELILNLQKIAS